MRTTRKQAKMIKIIYKYYGLDISLAEIPETAEMATRLITAIKPKKWNKRMKDFNRIKKLKGLTGQQKEQVNVSKTSESLLTEDKLYLTDGQKKMVKIQKRSKYKIPHIPI